MNALDSNIDKKYLLDMLAYLLWQEDTEHELSIFHINFGKQLYREVLDTLKREAQQWKNSKYQDEFSNINLECQDLGNLFFLEKRLEMIEQRLAKKNSS